MAAKKIRKNREEFGVGDFSGWPEYVPL